MLMTDKQQVIQEVKDRLNEKITTPSFYVQIDQYTSPNDMKNRIEQVMYEGFDNFKYSLIEAIVDEIYSDEKFELDIGLR